MEVYLSGTFRDLAILLELCSYLCEESNVSISEYGKTSNELLETETNVREIWWALCRDFDVPKERWLGPDL